MRFDEDRGGLVLSTLYGGGPEWWNAFVLPGEGTSGRAFQERRVIWTDDRVNDPSAPNSDPETRKLIAAISDEWGAIGVIAAPIMIRSEVYGILQVAFNHHRGFTDEDINLIQSLADSAAVAINNAQFMMGKKTRRNQVTTVISRAPIGSLPKARSETVTATNMMTQASDIRPKSACDRSQREMGRRQPSSPTWWNHGLWWSPGPASSEEHSMDVLFGTLIVFAVVTAAMSIGVIVKGRELKGSCGGVGNGCPCTEAEQKACASRGKS